ncbi:MAG: cyclopropane-fatty-acyl-phospholipid synthase family protein [Burkholderiaceae bacterium]|jgi:cyclopropane-fatty-acyl-phospholipid synthase|nr:cyclopropane-fatty-acyl-phospholipid synthase family protein [Burkholderiaceae bacterium]
MGLSATFALDSALEHWAERLRQRLDLPLLVRCNGNGLRLSRCATEPRVIVDVRNAVGVAALLAPSLDNLGRAYVEGHIDVTGTAGDIIDMAHRLAENGDSSDGKRGWMRRIALKVAGTINHSHTRAADQQAIQYHYDVSNDFYAEWLDPALVYSCAYFERGDETLAEAQEKKIDHILTKLRLQPDQSLLDIGCGWGSLVLRAAQKFGARCVGITLSQNQFDLATERVRATGLADRIDIRLQDYRDVEGKFDRITSIGMFEHVGLKNLSAYFRVIRDSLTPDGWAMNHGITSTDAHNGETSHGAGHFVDQYVFPQGELPHVGTVLTTMQEGGLEPFDIESLRRHYARTLQCWSDAFEAKAERLKSLVAEKTWRIWRMYLIGSQWAFDNDEISLFQVLCRRAGQQAASLPWSRRWIYDDAGS